jgi:hypothetical protein
MSSARRCSALTPRLSVVIAIERRLASLGGCFCQCGRASAPMILHRVRIMRGTNIGTGTALKIAR